MDESGETKGPDQPNRRTRILEKHMQKLAGFGMYGKMSGTLLAALTEEQATMLRRELGPRGITSIESAVLKDCRDRHKRAKTLGYEDVEDRYASDVTFCDRVHGEGRGLSDCIFDDMFAYANLPDPPRTRTQISAGVAANAQNENCLSKLIFMSQPRGVEGFPIEFRKTWKTWGFMFGRHIFTEDEFVSYIGRRGAFRGLLTWKGTVQVPVNGTLDFLEKLYQENLPLVRSNLERKEKQSAAAKAGGPGGQKADPTVAPAAERKRKAEADTSATGHADTAASSSARADASHVDASFGPHRHHSLHQNHQHPKEEQDHSWSLRHRPLQKQQAQSHQRLQAPVARMPPGVGIVITMVHAVNGVSGVGLGITVMRPAAVGSIGTAGRR